MAFSWGQVLQGIPQQSVIKIRLRIAILKFHSNPRGQWVKVNVWQPLKHSLYAVHDYMHCWLMPAELNNSWSYSSEHFCNQFTCYCLPIHSLEEVGSGHALQHLGYRHRFFSPRTYTCSLFKVNAKKRNASWNLDSNGSGNGLLPDGSKLLPDIQSLGTNQWNSNQNSQIFVLENTFENMWKMVAILFTCANVLHYY